MKKEMWDNIEKLSELRSNYSCFDEREQPYYQALSLGIEGIKALEQTRWIPVSERLPKENEYVGNVCKYYLIQDEYGDMHVAHLSNVGWIPMDSLKAIGNEIIAWQELPQEYVSDINVGDIEESEGKE